MLPLPTVPKSSKLILMKNLTATLCLTLAVLIGSMGVSYAQPECAGSPQKSTEMMGLEWRDSNFTKSWSNCVGSVSQGGGTVYAGEWINGRRHGKGIQNYFNGRTQEGIWENGIFKYTQKVSATIRARIPLALSPAAAGRKSIPPSKSTAELENERLKKEIARLEKEKQSKPRIDRRLAKRTQEALQVLGLYSGKLDGIIGVRTNSAIRGWQRRNGYFETGEITETQVVKLEQEATQHLAMKNSTPKQVAKRPSPQKLPPPKSGTTGSGFFVSKLGHIITNEHVVRECGSITVGDNANKHVAASVLEADKRNDLALLRISSTQMASVETKSLISKLGLKLVPLASEGLMRSEDVELGEDVLVSGYPYGELFSNTIKVTKGIVSANKGMGDDSGQFQMDAAVQSGNSGGPIYDENGNIVGVVVAQLNKLKFAKAIGSMPENVNFGIKASTVRQFMISAGLPTKWSNRTKRQSTKELAKIAKNQTVMVVCNP